MIRRAFRFLFLGCVAAGASYSTATGATATVTEAVNQVSHGSLESSKSSPATNGTHLQVGEYLKTGVESRAELELSNQSITRLGANTIFNYSPENNEIDLQAGTVLFSKPKNGKQMNIKSASVTAAIVGTTGFAQKQGKSCLFGLVEGHARVTFNGKTYPVNSGQIGKFTPGQPPQFFNFNVPQFLKTSPLITKFHGHLPTQPAIDKEVETYNDLVARGFVQPPKEPFFLTTATGSVPAVPQGPGGRDSAGNALNQANTTPPPPPPKREGFGIRPSGQ